MSKENSQLDKVAGTEVTFFIPNTEELGTLKDLKPEFSLTLKYKTSDDWAALKDRPVRVFYMGTKEIPNDEGEAVKCGVFVSESECFISGQMVLVNAVAHLDARTPIEIIYRGKSANKTSDGQTMKFDVTTLGK